MIRFQAQFGQISLVFLTSQCVLIDVDIRVAALTTLGKDNDPGDMSLAESKRRNAGILKNAGMLECWNAGIIRERSERKKKCWDAGMLRFKRESGEEEDMLGLEERGQRAALSLAACYWLSVICYLSEAAI